MANQKITEGGLQAFLVQDQDPRLGSSRPSFPPTNSTPPLLGILTRTQQQGLQMNGLMTQNF